MLFKLTISSPIPPPKRADERWAEPVGTWFCEARDRAEAQAQFAANLPAAEAGTISAVRKPRDAAVPRAACNQRTPR